MLLKLLILSIFCYLNLTNGQQYSSVLIWDSSSSPEPALKKISAKDLSQDLKKDLSDSMLVVFNDDEFQFKEIIPCKLTSGEHCYERLAQIKNKIYYLNVDDPIHILKNLNLKKEYLQLNDNSDLDDDVDYETGKIVFIQLPKSIKTNENHAELLHERDSIINNIYEKLSSKGKTVGLYIASSQNILKRVSRQVSNTKINGKEQQQQQQRKRNDDEKKIPVFILKDKFIMYYKNLSLIDANDKTIILDMTRANIENITDKGFNIELHGDNNSIKFRIDDNSGYWEASNFHLNNKELNLEQKINAAEQFSYYCGNLKMYNTEQKIKLIWSHLQLEPYFNATLIKNSSLIFNDPWHCVGFTSIGIWSGLFVSFMLLAILSIGITWLMNINTMDRFDDPKGKTITVNVSE